MAAKFLNLLAMMRKPYYPFVGFFPAGMNTSWIPDNNMDATETPNGSTDTFTFPGFPSYVILNGVEQYEGIGFQRVAGNGNQVQFLTNGIVYAPPTGSTVRGRA